MTSRIILSSALLTLAACSVAADDPVSMRVISVARDGDAVTYEVELDSVRHLVRHQAPSDDSTPDFAFIQNDDEQTVAMVAGIDGDIEVSIPDESTQWVQSSLDELAEHDAHCARIAEAVMDGELEALAAEVPVQRIANGGLPGYDAPVDEVDDDGYQYCLNMCMSLYSSCRANGNSVYYCTAWFNACAYSCDSQYL